MTTADGLTPRAWSIFTLVAIALLIAVQVFAVVVMVSMVASTDQKIVAVQTQLGRRMCIQWNNYSGHLDATLAWC